MKIAFLNLCHCEPKIVERVANKLTAHPDFDMYIHVDQKSDIKEFITPLKNNAQVHFVTEREKVYWGGYAAIEATFKLLRAALASDRNYDYFVTLQNLDYPIKSNQEIFEFFKQSMGTEYIRGCKISYSKDWQFYKKYKFYYQRDDDFYLKKQSTLATYLRYLTLATLSLPTLFSNGTIKEEQQFHLYYGAAQWAITRNCAKYIDEFEQVHPKFNQRMKHIQFPDEEYFHTIVHNSSFKTKCRYFDEPVKRWLVNWRNLHYFEFPKEVSVFTEKDFIFLKNCEELFIRKVRFEQSQLLMDQIDQLTN